MKKFISIAIIIFSMVVAVPALAGSMVKSTNIKADAIFNVAPKTFDIVFAHKVRLATVGIETPLGEVFDVGYKARKTMGDTFSVSLPELESGDYILAWRAEAKDGHVMSGSVPFSIS